MESRTQEYSRRHPLRVPPEFTSDIRTHRRAQLLNLFLILMAVVLAVASIFNWLVVDFHLISLVEAILAATCVWAYYRFHAKLDMETSSWVVSSVTGSIVLILILYTEGQRDSYALTILYPLLVYPLHGARLGSIAYLVFSLLVLATFVYGWNDWPYLSAVSSLFNVAVILTLGGGIVFYYEITKEEALDKVHTLSMTDPLTGVWNRAMFDELLEHELANARRHGSRLSLIIADIDYFKRINDTHGHHVGDRVLRKFAAILAKRKRATDHLARWGGEEFALILPNTGGHEAEKLARDLLRGVRDHRFEQAGFITVSLGIGEYRPDQDNAAFFAAADLALYEAKRKGRDRYAIARPEKPHSFATEGALSNQTP